MCLDVFNIIFSWICLNNLPLRRNSCIVLLFRLGTETRESLDLIWLDKFFQRRQTRLRYLGIHCLISNDGIRSKTDIPSSKQ